MPTIDRLLAEGAPPLVAILRGLVPGEAVEIAAALVEAGVRMIEVPLNSPDPFESIAAIQAEFGNIAAIGAGTVLDIPSVERLAALGARLMVTPNTAPDVIARGVALGLEVMPGFMTPSEAFAAIGAGARRLKLFPAGSLGPQHLKAIGEVLPREVGIWAVGGVSTANLADWFAAGAQGVAVGGSLFRPGDAPAEVARKAGDMISALNAR